MCKVTQVQAFLDGQGNLHKTKSSALTENVIHHVNTNTGAEDREKFEYFASLVIADVKLAEMILEAAKQQLLDKSHETNSNNKAAEDQNFDQAQVSAA